MTRALRYIWPNLNLCKLVAGVEEGKREGRRRDAVNRNCVCFWTVASHANHWGT